MAKALRIVMDTDSYDLDTPEPPTDLFRPFSYLLSERSIEKESIDQYLRQKVYQLVWSPNRIENAGEENLYSMAKLCQYVLEGFPPADGQLHYIPGRNFLEVFNHVNAATYILAQIGGKKGEKDLSEDMILNTHVILACGIDTESTAWHEYRGKYRKCPMQAGFHQFLHEERVPSAMRQIIQDYTADTLKTMENGEIDPIALAAKYCHIFVNIHPFEAGNGQMCRLILNAILFKHTCCLVAFGHNDIDRERYRHIAADAICKEQLCDIIDLEDVPDDLQPRNWRSLASFTLEHTRETMQEMHQLGQGLEE